MLPFHSGLCLPTMFSRIFSACFLLVLLPPKHRGRVRNRSPTSVLSAKRTPRSTGTWCRADIRNHTNGELFYAHVAYSPSRSTRCSVPLAVSQPQYFPDPVSSSAASSAPTPPLVTFQPRPTLTVDPRHVHIDSSWTSKGPTPLHLLPVHLNPRGKHSSDLPPANLFRDGIVDVFEPQPGGSRSGQDRGVPRACFGKPPRRSTSSRSAIVADPLGTLHEPETRDAEIDRKRREASRH